MSSRWQRSSLFGVAVATMFVLVLGCLGEASAIGLLIPKDEGLPPLAVKSHRVDVKVAEQAAVTKIDQVFINHTERQLEATFYFPVPAGATVSDFSLWIGGRKVKGAVLERNKARRIYEDILRRTQDPGLVEYLDGTLFRARIFPVPARGEQRVEIAYATVLPNRGSLRTLTYPLRTGRASAALLDDLTIDVRIESRAGVRAVYSPSHPIAVTRTGKHTASVHVEQIAASLDEDFVLYIGSGEEDVGLSVLTYDKDGPGGDPGYFLMVLSPSLDADRGSVPKKAVTFVVDTSGSMSGKKMRQAKKALASSIQRLNPGDRFNVVRFSTDVESLFAQPVSVDDRSRAVGVRFADSLVASGGTAIQDAVKTALRADPKGLPHYVIFLTDGRPTVGSTELPTILKDARASNRRGARVFTMGVGYDVNAVLLDRLASDHRGTADYVRPNDDIVLQVAALYEKIAHPALTDLSLDLGHGNVHDVYPRKLPDLFQGSQLVVLGRMRTQMPTTIKLTGRMDHEIITVAYDEVAEMTGGSRTVHDFIPKLWATRKVGYLLEEIRVNGELPELKLEVMRLATTYGLVTPYTSYLAVDDAELAPNRPGVATNRGAVYDFNDDLIQGELVRPREIDRRRTREKALERRDNLGKSSGKAGVDTSIATNWLKDVKNKADATNTGTRWVDGKLFVYRDGRWREKGTEGKKARKIRYGSKEYMDIVKSRPEIRKKLAVDRNVVFEMDDAPIMVE